MSRTMNKMSSFSYLKFQLLKKRLWLIGLLFIALFIFTLLSFCKTVTAQRSQEKTKNVASVEVKDGDTLWSIASNYYSDEFDNLDEYVKEIKNSNGLYSDTIQTGNYIIVPYYIDETR